MRLWIDDIRPAPTKVLVIFLIEEGEKNEDLYDWSVSV